VSQDKQRQPDQQSLLAAHKAQARRARRAALKALQQLAQSPQWQKIRRAWRDAQERGLIPKIPEEIKERLRNEPEEQRNARLDAIWRRMRVESEEERNARLDAEWQQMQAESEEERNARLDERWRQLQEERERELRAEKAASKTAREEAKSADRSVKRRPGGQFIEFPHLSEVLNKDLRNALVKKPDLLLEEQVGIVIKGLGKRGTKVDESKHRRTIERRIKDWHVEKSR